MRNAEYKRFKEAVTKAGEKDVIWCLGYLWIDLTKHQANDILKILAEKPFTKEVVTNNGHEALETPAGLQIWKEP